MIRATNQMEELNVIIKRDIGYLHPVSSKI